MTSKERVHAALRREPVDRVPVFMWFHPETEQRLATLLEVPPALVARAMGNDIRQAWVSNNHAMEGVRHEHEGGWHVDAWGVRWVRCGGFNQIAASPLAKAGEAEVRAYSFPPGRSPELLAPMRPLAGDKQHFIGCDVSPCVFEMYARLRGMAEAMLDLAAAPELAAEMLARSADFAVALAQSACQELALDWLWTGDDVAGQQAPLMHPDQWRELVKPHLQRVFDVGAEAGVWVAYHCCGALRPLIGDLVEMGLHVLNPIQCNCPGMAPLELKREFGERLAFMGGVDTQDLLPNGSEAEVRRATRRLVEGMSADGGGYILAASHTVPPETPMANLFAMFAEAGISREEIHDRAADLRRSPGE